METARTAPLTSFYFAENPRKHRGSEWFFVTLHYFTLGIYQNRRGQTIKTERLKCVVIVISGDIQPEARDRVLSLGALDFIKKPVNKEKLQEVLYRFGLL